MNNYFDEIFVRVGLSEGGYANDKDDAGGETYLGISIVNNPDLKMWPIIHAIIAASGTKDINAKLKAIPTILAEVKKIYKQRYWDPIQLDNINSKELAYQIFDHAVNAGVGAAIQLAYELVGLPKSSKYTTKLGDELKKYGSIEK